MTEVEVDGVAMDGVEVDGAESGDDADGIADGLEDSPEECGTEELVMREALVVGVVLVGVDPMVVCIVAGPESRLNSRDGLEQHSESLNP